MNPTPNQIVSQLREIATRHAQINYFGFGLVPEIGKSEGIIYPLMWGRFLPAVKRGNNLVIRLEILFADLVHKDISNQLDVSNDQLLTALDVEAQLQHPDYEFDFDEEATTLEPVYEKIDDEVTGWLMGCELVIAQAYNRCAIPFIPSPPTPENESGFVTIYNYDGSLLDYVSNNSFYTLANSVTEGIVAHAGGGQANATILNTNFNMVDTVASNLDSCKLDAALVGKVREVFNTTDTNDMNLYPASGQRFKNGTTLMAVNAPLAIGAGNGIKLVCYAAGIWRFN